MKQRIPIVATILLLLAIHAGAFGKTLRVGLTKTDHTALIENILKDLVGSSEEFDGVRIVTLANESEAVEAIKNSDVQVVLRKPSGLDTWTLMPVKSFETSFPQTWKKLDSLKGQLSESVLTHLESLIKTERRPLREVTAIFIGSLNWKRLEENRPAEFKIPPPAPWKGEGSSSQFLKLLGMHLLLVFGPLVAALMAGIPIAPLVRESKLTKNALTSLAGVLETIPPLVVLCLFIPSFGLGNYAVAATIWAWDLLSILRSRDQVITRAKQLAIVNVSFVTLGAFVGGGGLGIWVTLGLALKNWTLTLRGAMAIAVLAMVIKWTFEGLEIVLSKRRKNAVGLSDK